MTKRAHFGGHIDKFAKKIYNKSRLIYEDKIMKQKNTVNPTQEWGQQVSIFSIHPRQLAIVRRQMLANDMPTLKNMYGSNSVISVEEYIIDDAGNIFQKKTLNEGTPNEKFFYEALFVESSQDNPSNGDYLKFVYEPYVRAGEFNEVVLKQNTGVNDYEYKAYTDKEIDEMIAKMPTHPLLVLMTTTLNKFGDIPSNKKDEQTVQPTQNQMQ